MSVVEIWSLFEEPLPPPPRYPKVSIAAYQREMVSRMSALAAVKGLARGVPRRVHVLDADNNSLGTRPLEDAIRRYKPFIVDLLREDLVAIDFDDVPESLVRRFVRNVLSAHFDRYAVVPSGSAPFKYDGVQYRSFHIFVIVESEAQCRRLLAAIDTAEEIARTDRRDQREGPMSPRCTVKALRAIRGPLFSHRSRVTTEQLRRFTRQYPWVLPALLDVFSERFGWRGVSSTTRAHKQDRYPPIPQRALRTTFEGIADEYRELLNADCRLGEQGSTLTRIVNHLEARGFSQEQIWQVRRRPGLAGLWASRYGKRMSEEDAWWRLCDAWGDARRSRLQFENQRPPSPVKLLAAAVLMLKGSHFKIFVACVDAARNGMVTIGQTRLEEQAGVGSHTTTREATDALIRGGWLYVKSPGEMWIARILGLALPAHAQSKLEDTVTSLPPERGGGHAAPRADRNVDVNRGERAKGALSALGSLREILRSHAMRAGGLSAGAVQLILADLLGIPREALPISERTRARQIRLMQRSKILDAQMRLTRNWAGKLRRLAVAKGLDARAERQRQRNHDHQVREAAKQVRRARDPGGEISRIERLKGNAFTKRVESLL